MQRRAARQIEAFSSLPFPFCPRRGTYSRLLRTRPPGGRVLTRSFELARLPDRGLEHLVARGDRIPRSRHGGEVLPATELRGCVRDHGLGLRLRRRHAGRNGGPAGG